jgi:hypothetical protein
MEGKARFIFPVVISSMMVFMVTLVTLLVTTIGQGFPPDFFQHWAKAYFIAWPVAAGTAFLVIPTARRTTQRIVSLIEGDTAGGKDAHPDRAN